MGKAAQDTGLRRKVASKDKGERKRMLILDQHRCKPNSAAFQYLKKYARMCGKECISVVKMPRAAEDTGKGIPNERIIISENACMACLTRAKQCPGDAVKIVNLPQGMEHDITHQYGANGFRLHGLPSPRPGAVLGLLGANGIGKSTALKVLAGKLKPNLGTYFMKDDGKVEPPTWGDIVTYYRGSDLQQYLSRLIEDDLRVVTKVQLDHDYVAKLRGKVAGDVLRARDQRGVMDELVKRLELEPVLEREIQTLSGGELQRFAVCVVCLQDADVYMFDEASSFLDIKQRITVTETIRELSRLTRKGDNRPKYVVVVEHDLAVLDYMSDYVSCLYGVPGAYGVVVKVASVTNGINNYLAGFFPAENLRFRSEEISFSVSAASRDQDDLVSLADTAPLSSISYPDMSKTLTEEATGSTFTLHVEGGTFHGTECIGLLGQNGCGKTTFMEMLAGKFAAKDKDGKPQQIGTGGKDASLAGLGVSYKRQIYAPRLRKFDGTVEEILQQKARHVFADRLFRLLVIKPLALDAIYKLHVKTLSGGELQRVAIALCLGARASVYLLDEPSAGLDCEQRIIAAKVIRRWVVNHLSKTVLIIEHDLVMASALSDRVVVYEGQPGVECTARRPFPVADGFNSFLKQLNVTLRRDPSNQRPRVNKRGSQMDQEQRATGQYFTFDQDHEELRALHNSRPAGAASAK